MTLEQPQSSFVMRGARDAISHGLQHIEAQVHAIEQAVTENPGLAFDLAKTLVESTCRTILTERKVLFASDHDLPKLFRTVRENLPVLPPQENQATTVRQSIIHTLNGLTTTIQGITELRNQLGFASHGTDRPRPLMEPAHAMLAAQAADAVIGFLYVIHTQDRSPSTYVESSPLRHSVFDSYVDENFESVQIFESEFWASEILFQMEPDSYRIHLADYLGGTEEPEEEE